jgi:hypothetical protein
MRLEQQCKHFSSLFCTQMSAETNDEKLVLHIWGTMACLIHNVLFHVRSVRRRTQGKRTEELKEIMRLEYGENTDEPEKVLQSLVV